MKPRAIQEALLKFLPRKFYRLSSLAALPMLRHEVKQMENGFYALFLQTGAPTFYLLAKHSERSSAPRRAE